MSMLFKTLQFCAAGRLTITKKVAVKCPSYFLSLQHLIGLCMCALQWWFWQELLGNILWQHGWKFKHFQEDVHVIL